MTEEERLRAALEAARAKFHGLSCALVLHLRHLHFKEGEPMSLGNILDLLREGNRQCADALGYRGQEGIHAAEARLK